MKFISLNVERSLHLKQRVLPFLKREKPDALCVQELCPHDIPAIEDMFGHKVLYAPMNLHGFPTADDERLEPIGVGLVAQVPMTNTAVHYYAQQPMPLQPLEFVVEGNGNKVAAINSIGQVAVSASVDGVRIMTTHLAVTEKGTSTPAQRALAQKLVSYAQWEDAQHGNLVLCGDFNAPRGRETWAMLAKAFTDNLPPEVETTIDGNIHRAGPLPYVVDGLFTQGKVKASQVRLQNDVSDHMAVLAEVEAA